MPETVGRNVRRIRERKQLTQETIASRLGLKRSAQMSLVESSRALPKPETIVRYAEALGCAPRDLLEGVETPYDRLRAGKPLAVVARPARAGPREMPAARRRRASSG